MATQKQKITDLYASDITRAEELAYELRIHEVMTKDPICLDPEMKMETVLSIFQENRFSGAPVTLEGELIGILSLEDLIRSLRNNDLNGSVRE